TSLAIVAACALFVVVLNQRAGVTPTPPAIVVAPTASPESSAGQPTQALRPTGAPGSLATSPATDALPPQPPTAAPAATRTPAPAPAAWQRPDTKYGIHLLLDDGRKHWLPEVWPQHVQAARQILGEGGYVVQLVRLDDLDVARWQYFFDLCAEQRLVPILRLATPYDHDNKWWEAPPTDPDGVSYTRAAARFRDWLAQLRWPPGPRYAIVHNEPNRGDEWGNRPDPAQYARYLRDVGQALHQVGVSVLGPALDLYAPHSNGQIINGYTYIDAESFLDGMAAAEPAAFDVIDVWAAHAYPLDPFRFDPSRQVFQIDMAFGASNPRHLEPPAGIYNRGVNSYRWELWKVEQLFGPQAADLPVMITESGWRHAPSQDPAARDDVHAEVSFETLSTYLDLAFNGNGGRYPGLPETGWTPWNEDDRVLGVVLFALGGYPKDWGHTNWVTVDAQGQVTGLYPIELRR
ncbi:MAG: hypothetical protein P8129_15720, partial [Anaerolineae bacterium]